MNIIKKFNELKTRYTIGNNGVVERIGAFAIAIAVAAIVVGLMANVLSTVRSGQTTNDYAYNASTQGLASLNTFSQYLPTVALVLVAALIIGIIVKYFYFGRGE